MPVSTVRPAIFIFVAMLIVPDNGSAQTPPEALPCSELLVLDITQYEEALAEYIKQEQEKCRKARQFYLFDGTPREPVPTARVLPDFDPEWYYDYETTPDVKG